MAFLSSFYPQPVVAGTTEGTFAEGDDSRITGALPAATAGTGSVLASGSSESRTLANRFADVVNVKDFGAVGDGVANDGSAVRNAVSYAIDNGKAVYFPRGNYLINTTSAGLSAPLQSNSHSLIECLNNSSVAKQIVLIGDDATITSNLYPTIYTGGFNIGYGAFQSLIFLNIVGNYDRVHVNGLNFVSDRPLQEGDRWDSPPLTSTFSGDAGHPILASDPSPTQAHGRVFGIVFDQYSSTRTPINITLENLKFVDNINALRFNAGKDIVIDKCSFLYNYGITSVGNSELAVGIYNFVRNINYMKVSNCLFDGHVNPDADPSSSSFNWKRAADGFIVTFGSNTEGSDNAGVIISNNTVRNFTFEGIMTLGSTNRTLTAANVPSLLIANNTIDGRLPSNHRNDFVGAVGGNWGIVVGASNATIIGNSIFNCNVGIKLAGNPTVNTVSAYNNISNNQIIMPSTNVIQSPIGINIGTRCDHVVVQSNYVLGVGITASDMQGWDGVSEVVNINATSISIPHAIVIEGTAPSEQTYADVSVSRFRIQNNYFKATNKNSGTVASVFRLGGSAATIVTSINNYYDGWDFLCFKSGGAKCAILSINDTIRNFLRINSNYVALQYDDASIIKGSNEFLPPLTGWYKMIFRSSGSYNGKIKISSAGFTRYGDTTLGVDDNAAYQNTELNIQTWEGTSSNKRWLATINHTSGDDPAITKTYIRQSFGATEVYFYVNKVTTKLALTFGGGTPDVAAQGYANIVNGVVDSVTITSGGSGYDSSPSISFTDPVRHQISGSGAIFSATVAGGVVTGVTVTNGGSGYLQPIVFEYETNESIAILAHNGLQSWPVSSSTPSGGTEIVLTQGKKSLSKIGSNSITGEGQPLIATTAPESTPEFIGQQYINTSTGIAYLAAGTSSLANWNALPITGSGAPTTSAPNGSIYLRTDGDPSSTVYVRAGDQWRPLGAYEP
jgi:hypothetical protein